MQREMFRSTFNRVLSVFAFAALGVLAFGALATGTFAAAPSIALGAAGGAALVWAVLWAPYVAVDDDAVVVANVLTEHRVAWAALIHVETRYALVLHTPGRHISATAAPAPGALGGIRSARAHRRSGDTRAQGIRPGDLPTTDSGRAADLVHTRWDALRDAGRVELGVADVTPVQTRVRVGPIAALVLGATALIGAVLLV